MHLHSFFEFFDISSKGYRSLQFDKYKLILLLTCEAECVQEITQNHRMLGVGRDLCGSSIPTPLPKQGHLKQGAKDLVQAGFECLQRESTTPLGSLFQCSVTLRVKKFFLLFRWNFLCFSLCLLPLVLSQSTTEKSLAITH